MVFDYVVVFGGTKKFFVLKPCFSDRITHFGRPTPPETTSTPISLVWFTWRSWQLRLGLEDHIILRGFEANS